MIDESILEIEDFLQDQGVFVSMHDNSRKCHQDSYGTIVEFDALDKAIHESEFPAGIILVALDYWREDLNVQPPLRIVASYWERAIVKAKGQS